MLTAHLPASYLLTRFFLQRPGFKNTPALLAVGLIAGLLPDIDMLYFYLIDMRQHHHHTYWTHLPIFWLGLLVPLTMLTRLIKNPFYTQAMTIFGTNLLLHLVLDSVVGDIWWLSPFLNQPYALFSVPDTYGHWVLNFMLHWSFGLEIVITAIALRIWRRDRGKPYGLNI